MTAVTERRCSSTTESTTSRCSYRRSTGRAPLNLPTLALLRVQFAVRSRPVAAASTVPERLNATPAAAPRPVGQPRESQSSRDAVGPAWAGRSRNVGSHLLYRANQKPRARLKTAAAIIASAEAFASSSAVSRVERNCFPEPNLVSSFGVLARLVDHDPRWREFEVDTGSEDHILSSECSRLG
jgi:hypothetical protein